MNKRGYFTKKNAAKYGADGGKKRATTLSKRKRRAIARRGGLARHGLLKAS